jgi:TonB-dependent SusC/RagA subfamily outer membrane receptor
MKARIIIIVLIVLVAGPYAEGQKRGKMITVTGTVKNTGMLPVSGALIVVDGQSSGVVSKSSGTFKLKLRPDTRSVGAYTKNLGTAMIIYEGQTVLDFVLDSTKVIPNFAPEMDEGEQRINIGYGTVKRNDMTTQVGYIDGQADANASYTDIYDLIRGKVPGVQVSGNKITIRGINSINLDTGPLFVIDGIVVSSIDNISPRQVKSITVLKGSDASIYGSRGAGGVILITLIGSER